MINTIQQNLNSLANLIRQIGTEEYQHKSIYLSNATIGGHTRHIIEIAECMVNGYSLGFIDYINRKRNLEIEFSREYALQKIHELQDSFYQKDKTLEIVSEIDNSSLTVKSTYYRELMYNIEHITHHFALIKVTLVELKLSVVDENFGFAYSTIKYKTNLTKVIA